MEPFERDFHDSDSEFDDRPHVEFHSESDEMEESEPIDDEEDFYRHLEEY